MTSRQNDDHISVEAFHGVFYLSGQISVVEKFSVKERRNIQIK